MSGVGEAASVAGLVALAGQTVEVAGKTYRLVRAYKNVSPQAEAVVSEVQTLSDRLRQIHRFGGDANIMAPELGIDVSPLYNAVEQCRCGLDAVGAEMEKLRATGSGHGWKKMKAVMMKDIFSGAQRQISSLKQDLMLQMDILKCELSLTTSSDVRAVKEATGGLQREVAALATAIQLQCTPSENLLRSIDSRLSVLQTGLEKSIQSVTTCSEKQPLLSQSRTSRRRISRRPRLVELRGRGAWQEPQCNNGGKEMCMRVVSPALLTYQQGLVLHHKLVALEDKTIDDLGFEEKKSMVVKLQNLRLLLWLLRKATSVNHSLTEGSRERWSPFAREAGIAYSWQFCFTVTALVDIYTGNGDGIPESFVNMRWKLLFELLELELEDGVLLESDSSTHASGS